MRNSIIKTLATGTIAVGLPLIAYFEGYNPKAHTDPVGIMEICYGHKGAVLGEVKTKAECDVILAKDYGTALAAVDRLVIAPLPDMRRHAYGSFVYNLGPGNFARSTVLKKQNAGDIIGACFALEKWVCGKAKKGQAVTDPKALCYSKDRNLKVLPGLVTRRAIERDLCLNDLK